MAGVDTKETLPERSRFFGHGQDSFLPLGPECTLVTIGQPMAPAELEKVAELIRGRPEIMLRLHTRAGRDLGLLRHFPWLRRLSVALWGLEDIAGFSHLDGGLQHLDFGKTKKKFSLGFLAAMPGLTGLGLEGQSKDIAAIRGLSKLAHLSFRGITLPDLSLLTSFPQLQHFSLALGSSRDLSHLAGLPKLEVLHLLRINKLSDLSILSRLTSLRILSVDSMPNVTSLPNLSALMQLENVELDTLKGLTDLSGVASAPTLRRLIVAGTPLLDVGSFRCLVGHPTLAELRIYPSLGGAGLKKPVMEGVKQLLPEVLRT